MLPEYTEGTLGRSRNGGNEQVTRYETVYLYSHHDSSLESASLVP